MAFENLNAQRIAAAMEEGGMPATVEFHDRIASTSDRARARVILGQWDGVQTLCVAANHQTAGRGRRANAWVSPPGDSLLFTLVQPAAAWEKAGSLTALAAALAVAESLDALHGLRALIKWPNDVRIGGRKVCGVLVERASGAAGAAMLLGIGVNVNQSEAGFPPNLRPLATSVALECGHGADRLELLGQIAGCLQKMQAQFRADLAAPVLEAIHRRLDLIGQMVRVEQERAAPIEGTALGIEADGALIIRQTNGATTKCLTGSLIPLAGY